MKAFKVIWPFLKEKKNFVILSLVCAFVSAGCRLSVPYIAGVAIDYIIDEGFNVEVMGFYLTIMVSLVLVGSVFRYFFDQLTMRLGEYVTHSMRDLTYKHLLHAKISDLDKLEKGQIIHTLDVDVENVKTGLVQGLATLYDGIVCLLFTLGFMLSVNYVLTIIVIILTPLSVFVSRSISKRNSKYFKAQAANASDLGGYIEEDMYLSASIKSLGAQKQREEGFLEIAEKQRDSGFKSMLMASFINPATRLVNNIIYGVVIMAGVAMLLSQRDFGIVFTIGGLSSFLTYAHSYMTPFNEIAEVRSEISTATASIKRVRYLLNLPKDTDEGKKELPASIETINFEHLDFGYVEGQKVLEDFNLEVYPRHRIALVGPTGCGKTTLINLLLRFYDPQSGSIKFDDVDATEVPKKALRKKVSAVLQEPWIFEGTVAENIAYGRPEATREEIEAAAKLALADGFIRRLEHGYDTEIGRASSLSVGEKQLICLARAMLISPDIVILDEATSNIDLHTESLLKKGFDAFMEGRTSVVVAHRLSTIVHSDLIVVMKKGKIVEQGNHKQLMAKKGFYYELYSAQFA